MYKNSIRYIMLHVWLYVYAKPNMLYVHMLSCPLDNMYVPFGSSLDQVRMLEWVVR